MHCKSVLGTIATAALLLAASAAFAGDGVVGGYVLAIPVPMPNAHDDYGIIDDTPIIKGGPIISDGMPEPPENATAYILVTPHRHGRDSVNILVVPDGLYRHRLPGAYRDWGYDTDLP